MEAAMLISVNTCGRAGAVLLFCVLAGCQFRNNPPGTPAVPTGPTVVYGSSQQIPYFSSAVDPDGDSVYLGFDSYAVGNGGSSYYQWTRLVGSGDTASSAFYFYAEQTYEVRVRALDEHGAYSGWSEPLSVEARYESTSTKGLCEQ
jgi:hypothetical protein